MKPIFVVSFGILPQDEEMKEQIVKYFDPLKEDYHVLIHFEDREDRETKFKMFSDKEIEPIKIDELIAMLK